MLKEYEEFLKKFDKITDYIFKKQSKYIFCKPGCCLCCRNGEFPVSQLEFLYITQGFINLPQNTKILVQQNIMKLLLDKKDWLNNNKNNRFEHTCPFLINNICSIYNYRGIICRTFGLSYYDDIGGYIRLPDCVNNGLNYSQYYDKKNKLLKIKDIPKINLRINRVLESNLSKRHKIKEYGEIRPMLDWLYDQK